MQQTSPTDFSNYLSLRDCVELLPRRGGQKVSLAALYRWIAAGKLPAVKINRDYFVHPQDLADLAKPVQARTRHAPTSTTTRAQREQERQTEEILRRHGLR